MPAVLADLEVVLRNGDAATCASAGTCTEASPVVSPGHGEKELATGAIPISTHKNGIKEVSINHK